MERTGEQEKTVSGGRTGHQGKSCPQGTSFWWKLRTGAIITAVIAGTLYVSLRLGWSGEQWAALFLLISFSMIGAESYLRRYCRRGGKRFRKGDYAGAYEEFEKDYEFWLRHPGTDRRRHLIFLFYSRDLLVAGAVNDMIVSSIFMGNIGQARRLIGCLKEKWPESEAAGQDFSLWEPENYEIFRQENEAAMIKELSPLLRPGEVLDIRFYGVVTGNSPGRKTYKKQPCFIGTAGKCLLLAALKKPDLEAVLWRERIEGGAEAADRESASYPGSQALGLVCPNGQSLRIQCRRELCAAQYAGQEENVRRFFEIWGL